MCILLSVIVFVYNKYGDKVAEVTVNGPEQVPIAVPPGGSVAVQEVAAQSVSAKSLASPQPSPAKGVGLETFHDPAFLQWMKATQALPAEKQVEAASKKLRELNPRFDGKVTPKILGGTVTELAVPNDTITDISPVMAFSGLSVLNCSGSNFKGGLFTDLSPLHGMKLSMLNIRNSQVSDLSPLEGMQLSNLTMGGSNVVEVSPLKGMPLTTLYCNQEQIADLSPLRGMPLADLSLYGVSKAGDLSPLQGMPLTKLDLHATQLSDLKLLAGMNLTWLVCSNTKVSDLSPLRGMRLTYLICSATKVSDLSPLKGMPLTSFDCSDTPVSDLAPLRGMNLTFVAFMPKNITSGMDAVRQMTSLKTIGTIRNGATYQERFSPMNSGRNTTRRVRQARRKTQARLPRARLPAMGERDTSSAC